jgi:uncharacterized membrane protein
MSFSRHVLLERVRGSLFIIPLGFVVAGVALAAAMITIDDRLVPTTTTWPFITSTVDSARAVLGAVATATITVAGIAFSIALLVMQMASSQYSPRVVHGLFRDSFNKFVMGLVLGTFTYCLVVLQSVRSAVGDDGEDVVPTLSVLVGLGLGVAAILAVVAFINHNAHAMEVSEILQEVTDQTIQAVDGTWSELDDEPPPLPMPELGEDGYVITFGDTGWVQHLDHETLHRLVPPGGTVRFDAGVGRYAIAGLPLCTLWPRPTDPDDIEDLARSAVHLGRARTLGQDPAYGIRQIADVGIRALSTGIDDPTTAQDAIFHLAAILRHLHGRVPPPAVSVDDDDRCLVLSQVADQARLVRLAFEELRRSAADHPTVCVYLLEAMSSLCRAEDPRPPDNAIEELTAQARLVLDGARLADLLPEDRELVESAWRERFGQSSAAAS